MYGLKRAQSFYSLFNDHRDEPSHKGAKEGLYNDKLAGNNFPIDLLENR